jgi:K+-sensing histidine kinase KdpD
VEGIPAGIQIVAAPDARLEFANSEFVGLVFGPTPPRGVLPIYGRDFTFLRADGTPLEPGERPSLRALHGERVQNQQLTLHRAGGWQLPVSAHAAPLRSSSGEITHAIVVAQDVTKAHQAEQLKDDFLALISHELRTPLTAIHGGAHLIANETTALDAETRREVLADIVIESNRLDRMLGNLLTLTNLLAGRLRPTTEPVLVAPLARTVSAEVGMRGNLHEFVVELASDIPPIEADPALLEEVLRNLYENAAKYSPDGGVVRTSADNDGSDVAIHVTDAGIGIAPEHVNAVFERFRRVGGDPTVRGMGLGLYLSRMLVEAQGGRIWADSQGVGLGTTISVSFPVARQWDADGPD